MQFDVDYGAIVNVLKTPVQVSEAFDPRTTDPNKVPHKQYDAIWDTGATNTVITPKVVQELGLKAIGKTQATGVNTTQVVDSYLINLHLPNNVGFQAVRVSELPIQGGDVLVGMDIIRHGDFAISNVGKTKFSFRVPSIQSNILAQPSQKPVAVGNQPGRNDKVKIRNRKTGEVKELKWKYAQKEISKDNSWDLIS